MLGFFKFLLVSLVFSFGMMSVTHAFTLSGPNGNWDEISNTDLILNFEFEQLPTGYKVYGTFVPTEWCMGYLIGTGQIKILNASDESETIISVDGFGLLTTEDLNISKDSDAIIEINENLEIMYVHDEDPLGDSSIKIIDFDYDNIEEIIFRRPCGMRWGTDFTAFEIYGDFGTGKSAQGGFEFTSQSTFNPKEKSLSIWYSNGACLGSEFTYTAGMQSFILKEKIQFSEKSPVTGEEGCYQLIFTPDSYGELILDGFKYHDEATGEWKQ